MDGSRIRNKIVSFSLENGVVWTGSNTAKTLFQRVDSSTVLVMPCNNTTTHLSL